MASSRIEFHEEAAEEYFAAFDWYFQRSRLAAAKFGGEVRHSIENISQTPQRWPAYIHGTRKCLLNHFPFATVYRQLPAAIQVIAVAHARRRPGYWKNRV